ncbi:hypothetical protein EJ130_01585 [Micrococcus luteus]|uniref:hypothetical protein n=1 Tax=Micrococcus luteus TaxID=1270 RepID=UPI0022B46940|nr:hypothetical protein [Micrococcus luteus]MCV7460998.1 hypothetical protein [Micrococcus luteus]MCV7496516.1 hypothetical protein [Micrococcus luteus]MCZ6936999.1 hypothetical protein [Micrococcus luteus]
MNYLFAGLIVLGLALTVWGAYTVPGPSIGKSEDGRLYWAHGGLGPGGAERKARRARTLTLAGALLSAAVGVLGLFLT